MSLMTDIIKRALEKVIDVGGDVAGTWAKKKINEDSPSPKPAPGKPPQPVPRLLVMKGMAVRNQIALTTGVLLLHRGNLDPDDPTISRQHAEVYVRNREFFVADLGSANGTYLNGNRITGEHGLQPGDRIQIGHTLLVFDAG